MSDIDADFDALLNADVGAQVDAMLIEGANDASTADAALPMDTKPVIEEAKQPAMPSNKPTIGKKRQLLVPQDSNKRRSVQVEASSDAPDATELPPKEPSTSPPHPAAASTEPAASGPSSAASSPTKQARPTAAASEETKATDDIMEVDTDKDAAMDGAAEDEVQSPLKKSPQSNKSQSNTDKPQSNTDKSQSNTDRPDKSHNTQDKPAEGATPGGTASSKALAAGKRKGLTVAKAPAGPGSADPAPSSTAKPAAVKPKAPKAAITKAASSNSKGADPDASSEGAAGRKLPHAQTAYFFFMADKRAGLKEAYPGLSAGETSKKLGEMWKELSEAEKKPYNDMAVADKERVAAEMAALGPAVIAEIKKASADARAAKKEKKADKAADKAGKAEGDDQDITVKKSDKAAAKEAKKTVKAAAKTEEAAKKQAEKAEKAEAAKKVKAAFKAYHTSQYSSVKADNPSLDPTELNALIAKAWEALDQAERDVYSKKAEEAAEAAEAAAAAKATKSASGQPSKAAKGKSGKKTITSSDCDEDDEQEENASKAGGGSSRRSRMCAEEDDDDESDREDVDWESNPAAGIFSNNPCGFLVAREGLMLTEYGKVDARKAKERLLHGAAGSSGGELPASVEQVEEYETHCRKFWAAAKSRMNKGYLDLEELEEGSPLEACYLLGKLQEPGQELDPKAKRPKGDLDRVRGVPVMRLSKVVQRLLDLERRKTKAALQDTKAALQEVARLKAELASRGC